MFKNYVGKHPLQNRTNVQIKGGGGQRPFEQCSKKLHFFERGASLRLHAEVLCGGRQLGPSGGGLCAVCTNGCSACSCRRPRCRCCSVSQAPPLVWPPDLVCTRARSTETRCSNAPHRRLVQTRGKKYSSHFAAFCQGGRISDTCSERIKNCYNLTLYPNCLKSTSNIEEERSAAVI